MKNEQEKSDPSIVAKRPANKPEIAEVDLWGSGAESVERREGTDGNTGEQRTCRTPSRGSVSQGLERVREVAKQPGDLRQVLRDKIDACQGLIQIVGHGYGAEPPTVGVDCNRVSYTQKPS